MLLGCRATSVGAPVFESNNERRVLGCCLVRGGASFSPAAWYRGVLIMMLNAPTSLSLQVCMVFDMPIEGVFQRQHLQSGKTLLKGKKMDVTYAGDTKPVRVTKCGTGIVQGHCCNLQRIYIMDSISKNMRTRGYDVHSACGISRFCFVAYVFTLLLWVARWS